MKDIKYLTELLAQIYKNNIVNTGHNSSGKLKDFETTFEFNGSTFNVYFHLQDYWKYLENGTKPHFPPLKAIEDWIKVKRIVPYAYKGKVPTTKQLAYLISRKISKVGTKPTKLLQKSIDSADYIIDEITDKLLQHLTQPIEEELYGK